MKITSNAILCIVLSSVYGVANPTNPDRDTPVSLASKNATAIDFFPLAVGNSWAYACNEAETGKRTEVHWRVTQKEQIRGRTVFHLWSTPPQGDESFNLSPGEDGVQEQGTDRFLLRGPIIKGKQWTATLRSTEGKKENDVFEVLSASSACLVGGHRFENCTTVREIDGVNFVVSTTTYAAGVGPVQYVYLSGSKGASRNSRTTLTITSWHVAGHS